jgi:hypothetical protein
MNLSEALLSLLEQAAEAGARRALELHATSQPGVLIHIKQAPVSYRAILAANKAGELRVYRRGRAAFVRRDELETWIQRAPLTERAPAAATDEIAELIQLNNARRRRRATKRAKG